MVTISTESLALKYAYADFWRTGWTRAARSPRLSPLQSEHDRVEHRAVLASNRIRRLMHEHDALMARQTAELNFIKPQHINDGIMSVLGSLPIGAELRFFWLNGKQHLHFTQDGVDAAFLYLARNAAGVGIPTPAAPPKTSLH
jgi:hypothetical protein